MSRCRCVEGISRRAKAHLREAADDFSAPYVKDAMMKAFREPLRRVGEEEAQGEVCGRVRERPRGSGWVRERTREVACGWVRKRPGGRGEGDEGVAGAASNVD